MFYIKLLYKHFTQITSALANSSSSKLSVSIPKHDACAIIMTSDAPINQNITEPAPASKNRGMEIRPTAAYC